MSKAIENGWRDCRTDPPDDDTTVMLFDPSAKSETVWPGWKDGDEWLWSDGSTASPIKWMHFPAPPA